MRRMKRYTHDIRNSDGRIQSVIQESLQHRIVIKTLEQGERHLDKLDDLQDMLHSQVMGRTRFSLSAHMLVALAFPADTSRLFFGEPFTSAQAVSPSER